MTQTEALKIARVALGVQLDALLGKAGHLHNDDRRRYAENGIKAIDEALAQQSNEQVEHSRVWAKVEEYADAVHDFNEAVRIDVGIDEVGKKCLAIEKELKAMLAHPPVPTAQPKQEPKKDLMFATVAMQEREDKRIENIVATLEKIKQEQLTEKAQPKEPEQEFKCNPHPKAPHGFNRNASHTNDRYTCECESWDAYDAGYQAGVMAGIEASMGQEPEQEPVAIFEKTYDGESLYDLNRDIHEAFEEEFTPAIKAVPKDEYGIHTGLFRVTIEWASDEAAHNIFGDEK